LAIQAGIVIGRNLKTTPTQIDEQNSDNDNYRGKKADDPACFLSKLVS
jgi:hypothetical protein